MSIVDVFVHATRTLQNQFRKTLKQPIAAEIRRVRIERAKRELAHSDQTLAAIACDAGFGTIQLFYEEVRFLPITMSLDVVPF